MRGYKTGAKTVFLMANTGRMVVSYHKMSNYYTKVRITGRWEELAKLDLPKQWGNHSGKNHCEVKVADWYVARAVAQATRAITEFDLTCAEVPVIEKLSLPAELPINKAKIMKDGLWITNGVWCGIAIHASYTLNCVCPKCTDLTKQIKSELGSHPTEKGVIKLIAKLFGGHPKYDDLVKYFAKLVKPKLFASSEMPFEALVEVQIAPLSSVAVDEADTVSDSDWAKLDKVEPPEKMKAAVYTTKEIEEGGIVIPEEYIYNADMKQWEPK